MSTTEIPVEVRARAEANLLFDALRVGDYAGAAEAQERLRNLGWDVSRVSGPKRREGHRRAHSTGAGTPP